MKLNAATRLRASAHHSKLEEDAYELARYNYSLEHGDIRFSTLQKDAMHKPYSMTKEQVMAPEFYYGVVRAMEDMASDLRGCGEKCHDFIHDKAF